MDDLHSPMPLHDTAEHLENKKRNNKEIVTNKTDMESSLDTKANPQYQDSFFRMLFKEPRYRKALYLMLHSEDKEVADSEFENVELHNILNIDIYNDVCFTVHNRLIILMEHQSTLNYNMPVRFFLYLAEEYKRLLMRSEFSSALYTATLVKIPRPEFYIVYTGADSCDPDIRLSDAYIGSQSGEFEGNGGLELIAPVLTADQAKGVLAEYFDIIDFIKSEKKGCGSLETAVRHAILKYRAGYEISDFILNQKGVYDALFEQMTREELLAKQLEANTKVVTQQVTQQVTQRVKREDIATAYKMMLEFGVNPENARRSIIRNYSIKEEELLEILS